MQQAQQNPQMAQQVQQAQQQLKTQMESKIAELEATMIAEMAKQEQEKAGNMAQDPLVRLKQQEIDLKAAEVAMKGEQGDNKIMADIGIEAEKLDLERDKLEGGMQQTLAKEGLNAIKESDQQAIDEIKENMQTLREERKIRSTEKIATIKGKANGRKSNDNR